MSNTFTKGYADGASLTEAQLDTAYQSLQLDIANTALMTTGSTTGQAFLSNGSGVAGSFQTLSDPQGLFALRNYGLKASAAAGVLTVTLKTKALATPSGTDIVNFNVATPSTVSGTYRTVNITAATTLAISASASLGLLSTSTIRVYVYGYYNSSAATVKLAVSARSDFDSGNSVSASAMSSSADSRTAIYASASLSIVPRLLGWFETTISSGAWQSPSKVSITNTIPGSDTESGTFTVTSTQFTVTQTGTATFIRSGNLVTIAWPSISGTSNASTFTVTGMPTYLWPTSDRFTFSFPIVDGGTAINGPGYATIASASGTLTIFPDPAGSSWTTSGTKTLRPITTTHLLI